MGLASKLLNKSLEKQMAKQEESFQELPLTPLAERLMSELKEFVGGLGSQMTPYLSLFSGVVASSSDEDIRSALLAIHIRVEHILAADDEVIITTNINGEEYQALLGGAEIDELEGAPEEW